ncbi:hypothetical protein COCON_G00023930 [Conger conger]|uniref:KN motif and ankyrin repeat domain-containing protein 2 n=1 Tax=Conger conger TaxID=82655 RepID=A0A9Q1I6J3_CONCO|nr:hypothetical protein COCON_G00023930 [Conger conger]
MTQVLQMDSNFPGKSTPTPTPTPSFLGKEDPPYSVETPYGYRLDLDFLKYVDDIEKGGSVRRRPAAAHRRPRLGSLPRGYGYTGSWWTSTESLCSNASADSRQSSFSCCLPGYHGARPSAGGVARVERTLLDARRRLEEEREREKEGRKFSNLGSMRSSVAGSNTSLSSAHGLALRGPAAGSSGLSTPAAPSPALLQHVREQMALALRKIRQLEEQVKTIPVLQVKISVLQEEKRQLSVQLKSHRFLGPSLALNRARGQRGELHIHIPEDEAPTAASPAPTPTSPAPNPASPAPNPLAPPRHPLAPPRLPQAPPRPLRAPPGIRWRRVGQLEAALQELRAAEAPPPKAEPAVRATSVGWRELLGGATAAATPPALQSLLSFTQSAQRREQRSVGVQVYTLEQPLRACEPPPRPLRTAGWRPGQQNPPLHFLSLSAPGRLSTADLKSSSGASRREGSPPTVGQSHAAASQPAVLQRPLCPVLEHKAESQAATLSAKPDLQLNSAPTGCGSSSSEDSSSESSDEESDASEYHEARERLPETPTHCQSVPKQGTVQSPSTAPASAPRQHANLLPPDGSAPKQNTNQLPPAGSAPKPGASVSPSIVSAPKQGASQSPVKTQEKVPGKGISGPCTTQEARLQLSEGMMASLRVLQTALRQPTLFSQQEAKSAYSSVLQEWLRVSCHRAADTAVVRAYMDAFASVSPQLLEFVVNMADGNGNTALHYTVSHSNFPVVKQLLDTAVSPLRSRISPQVCVSSVSPHADKQNRAGYTAIMLTALAAFHSDSDLRTILQLLHSGDVNAKASQAGQTALMLAVSHGRGDMVRALLRCGAQVNVRDEDGSTALMCACEHGHVDIVRQLLSAPGCDATITDNDGSTALSIALEACQNDIAVLLYAHLNFAKPPSPVSPKAHQMGTSPPPAGERK